MATVNAIVVHNDDDVQRYSYLFTTTGSFVAGWYGGYPVHSAARFQIPDIASGDVVDVAHITLQAKGDASTVVNTDIFAEESDNATRIVSVADFDGRDLTEAVATWDTLPEWIINNDYNSPSLVDVLQEVFDRPGWVAGNWVNIFWKDGGTTQSGTVWRRAKSHSDDVLNCPKLHIEYTPGNGERTPRPPAVSGVPSAHF